MFKPDLSRFKMKVITSDMIALMKKRVLDMCGVLGTNVKVKLNG